MRAGVARMRPSTSQGRPSQSRAPITLRARMQVLLMRASGSAGSSWRADMGTSVGRVVITTTAAAAEGYRAGAAVTVAGTRPAADPGRVQRAWPRLEDDRRPGGVPLDPAGRRRATTGSRAGVGAGEVSLPGHWRALGMRLRAGRQARSLSQQFVAQRLGVTQTLIGRYEKGERCPSRKRLTVYAAVLSIDLEEVMALAGYAAPHQPA
jgi:DNA-binding XRE family transcriptional regulator